MSEIDWVLTKDVISIFGTVIALILAYCGLNTWHHQLKGTSEYELAKKAIHLTYQVQQEIQSVRDPMLHLSKEEVDAGRRLEEEQRIYNERMKYLYGKWAELQTIRLETKVIWSDDAFESFSELEKIIGELRGSLWLHFWMKGAYAGPSATVDNSPDRVNENNKVVYFVSENDEFTIKVKSAVTKVEDFFIKKVRSK